MRRPHYLIAASIFIITAMGIAAIAQPRRPEPVGPLTSTMVCAWDTGTRSYQTFIVYRDRNGEDAGRSAAAGWCEP